METLPLQSPLFIAASNVADCAVPTSTVCVRNGSHVISEAVEGRSRLHEAISNIRCRNTLDAIVAPTTGNIGNNSNVQIETRRHANSKPHVSDSNARKGESLAMRKMDSRSCDADNMFLTDMCEGMYVFLVVFGFVHVRKPFIIVFISPYYLQ